MGKMMNMPTIYQAMTILCLARISFCNEWEVESSENQLRSSDGDDSSYDCTTTNGRRGRCVTILDCNAVLSSAFNTTRTIEETMSILNEAHCGYENDDIKVCCPLQGNEGLTNSSQGGQNTTEVSEERPVTGLAAECGRKEILIKRIAGGRPAQLRSWPWIALIGLYSMTNPSWVCGGSLVTSKHVITAAHCIEGEKLIVVRLGELDWNTTADGANHIDIQVLRAMVHPHFKNNGSSDIAILILKDEVQFNDDIRPICLPFSDSVKNMTLEGLSPFIAGWGRLAWGGNRTSMLQEAQVDVIPNGECATAYARLANDKATIDKTLLCAGGSNTDACQYDSGGPLMLPYNRQYYLFGIVSYGYKCAEPGFPGVYVRVTEYLDWIKSKIELDS